MKKPRVIPPRPKAKAAAQPFFPRVAPPFPLGYGPLVYVPSLHRRPRPSKAPELFGGLTQNWRNKALQSLQDEDKPSCQKGGWSGDDWKEWKTSSDWSESQDWTWNSWNYKEKWSQDERYQERAENHTDAKQANSWESHTDEDKDYEYVQVEEEDSHEELIKRSREILQRHRGHRGDEVPILRSGKRERSPLLQDEVPILRSGKRERSPLLQEEPSSPKKNSEGNGAAGMPRREIQSEMASEMASDGSPEWRSESCATRNCRARVGSAVVDQYCSWCGVS